MLLRCLVACTVLGCVLTLAVLYNASAVLLCSRDGSDYSASIFGKLLRASAVQIWTDVDGVLSADPRKVPEAKVLPEVRALDRLRRGCSRTSTC